MPFKAEVDLYRIGRPRYEQTQDAVFQYDEQYPAVISEKLNVLQAYPDHSICYLTDDLENLECCLWRLAAKVAEEQPTHLVCNDNTFRSKLLGIQLTRDGELDFEPNQICSACSVR